MNKIFRIRDDLPPGFRNNPVYHELPAATKFLKQFDWKEYATRADLERDLADFPAYLEREKVPASKDAPLRAGFVFHGPTDFEGVENIVLPSAEVKHCWFGTFGSRERVEAYFNAQSEAHFRRIRELDDEW